MKPKFKLFQSVLNYEKGRFVEREIIAIRTIEKSDGDGGISLTFSYLFKDRKDYISGFLEDRWINEGELFADKDEVIFTLGTVTA